MIGELLAPVGEIKAVMPIIKAGADAIYVGLEGCSSRPTSADLSLEEIKQASDIAHIMGAKIYVAINGCLQDYKLNYVYEAIDKMRIFGVDAVIISDWGLLLNICNEGVKMDVHASTLLGVYNSETVKFLKDKGVSRVILSSNLFIDEISKIINDVPDLEYELIAQGGICFNDNRICELPHSGSGHDYKVFCKGRYELVTETGRRAANIINAKHISLHDVIAMYYELGIDSYKVEGRTVNYNYVIPQITKLKNAMIQASSNQDYCYSTLHYVSERRRFNQERGSLKQ